MNSGDVSITPENKCYHNSHEFYDLSYFNA